MLAGIRFPAAFMHANNCTVLQNGIPITDKYNSKLTAFSCAPLEHMATYSFNLLKMQWNFEVLPGFLLCMYVDIIGFHC